MTIQAGAVEHGMLADDIISGQAEITSGFAAADELMYSDAGTIKRVGLDTLATKLFSVASAGTVAQASDHMLFLDGGATGDVIVESIDDFLSAIAGSGLSVSSSQLAAASGAVTALNNATANELVTVGATTTELDAEANLTFDGTDLKLLKDANNADVSVVLGTADAESLTIQVLNGGSNKTAEEIHFSTATASSTANHGKMVFDVDGTDIVTIDDGGIDLGSGLTFAINGTDIVTGDSLNSLSAGAIADGDSIAFIDANDSNATKKEAVADLATLFAGDGLAASSSVLGIDLGTNSGLEIASNKLQIAKGISQHDVAQFTSGVVDNDFLRVDGTVVEGRSASEVLSDIGAQATLTFGISNTNAVKIDSASVADDEYARFTANGLESRSTSEVASDIGAATKGFATAMAIAL